MTLYENAIQNYNRPPIWDVEVFWASRGMGGRDNRGSNVSPCLSTENDRDSASHACMHPCQNVWIRNLQRLTPYFTRVRFHDFRPQIEIVH